MPGEAKELEIKINWQNGVSFKMTAKNNGGDIKTICGVDENGHISKLWEFYQKACEVYFHAELAEIGKEMSAT